MKSLVQFQHEMRILFRINILFLTFLLLGISQVFAQEVKTTSNNPQKSTIYDQMQVQRDSHHETPHQLGDIQLKDLEELGVYKDPSSVTNSVPMEEANWIFEVPVNVKNIASAIKHLVVLVHVQYDDNITGYRLSLGRAKTVINLVNGAYEGNVIVGVPYDEGLIELGGGDPDNYEPNLAKIYACYLMIQDPDTGDLWNAATVQCSPVYRMADPDEPFHIQSGGYIPKIGASDQ
jgi:hypothetical protein